MVHEKRVPHALLFSGPEGCGNLPTALAFLQHLFCTEPLANDSCGTCNSCAKISKLIHPDVHFVFPIAKSKSVKNSNDLIKEFREAFLNNPYLSLNDWFNEIVAENKQPIIPVEEAGDILKKLSYTSYEGGYKTMLIWLPEKMNAEAANKLLKILEEPPEKTVFVLVCNQADALLSTIISRVQQINFFKLPDSEIANELEKKYNIPKAQATEIALLCDGNFSEALNSINLNTEDNSLLLLFQNFMRTALKFDCSKALQIVEEIDSLGRERQKQFLKYGLEIFRDALMFNFGSKELIRLGENEKLFLEKFSTFITIKNYEQLIEDFNSNYYYIERNANSKIIFLNALLKANELLNTK